jgi:pimeloyl-ACP methyl ester carboxylesterase
MADAVCAVAHAAGGIEAVVAHSLGGPATTVAIARGLSVERLVYVGSPVDPSSWVDLLADALGLGDDARAHMLRAIEARAGMPLAKLDLVRLAGTMRAPLLVAHDRTDREVPWRAGRALVDAWPNAALLTTEGLGHRRILRDPAVIGAAVAFLTGAPARARTASLAT